MALPAAVSAQVDEDTGERENYILAPDGTMLVVTQAGGDDASGLVRRSAGGIDSVIVAPNATLSLGEIDGIGANPQMNADGVAAFQIEFLLPDADPNEGKVTAIYTGEPGDITEIASTGDTVDSEDICSIEPFPQINSADQVFFGTSVQRNALCNEDEGRKVIYRFTPPSTTVAMLVAELDGAGDQITVSDTDFVSAETTFNIVDAHLISFGGDVAAPNGGVMVTAVLQDESGAAIEDCDNDRTSCHRALLYLGPTAGDIELIALEGPDSIFDGKKIKGVANDDGDALFKAQESSAGIDSVNHASVQLWSGGALTTIAEYGQTVPGGTETFNGFTPHVDMNGQGNLAFTAGFDPGGGAQRGVYYKPSGGALVEVARTFGSGVGVGAKSSDGFTFSFIGSVAVVDECNTVYFVAENTDVAGNCGINAGDGEISGVFAWNNGNLVPVIREGDDLPEGQVTRIFVPMPELRQNGAGNQFVVRAFIDDDEDCVADIEEAIVATLGENCQLGPSPTPTITNTPGGPTNTPTNTATRTPTRTVTSTNIPGQGPPEIPALGPWGVWVMVGLLALAGSLYIWRRGV